MSVETITMLVGIASILFALAGGFGWMIRRVDSVENKLGARIDSVENRLGARIDSVEHSLGVRIDSVERKVDAGIDKINDELVEVKIAVARFEGPPRHLLPAR